MENFSYKGKHAWWLLYVAKSHNLDHTMKLLYEAKGHLSVCVLTYTINLITGKAKANRFAWK